MHVGAFQPKSKGLRVRRTIRDDCGSLGDDGCNDGDRQALMNETLVFGVWRVAIGACNPAEEKCDSVIDPGHVTRVRLCLRFACANSRRHPGRWSTISLHNVSHINLTWGSPG